MGLQQSASTFRSRGSPQLWHSGSRRPIRRVLMLTHRVPYPPNRGDRIRSYHLLRYLSKHFQISLASVADEPVTEQQREVLTGLTEQLAIKELGRWRSRLRGCMGLMRGAAITPSMLYDPGLARQVMQWHHEQPFDAVLTFCSGMINYARLLTQPQYSLGQEPARHVLDLVDVDSGKWARYARQVLPPMRWVYALEAQRLQRIESGRTDELTAISLISEAEVATYRRSGGHHPNVHVINNGGDQYLEHCHDGYGCQWPPPAGCWPGRWHENRP